MFGMGMGEIILIAVVALLVLGPERLPGAAKAIGKGIRDLRAQTKDLQSTIEQDTQIGDAVREIRGALRGDPETLYKRATGEDFLPKDSPEHEGDDGDGAAADAGEGEQSVDELHAKLAQAPQIPTAPIAPKAPPVPKAPKAVSAALAASTDDAWTEDADESKKEDVDPDVPVIRPPASAMARGDNSLDADSTGESGNDPQHG
jgi:sec-independent protein translocase protein TatB